MLHLGTGKTGTTTIQHLMRQSRAALAEQGVLYPRTPGAVRHARFGLSFRSDAELARMPAWHQMRAQSPERFRRRFGRRLRTEIAEADPSTVVFPTRRSTGSRVTASPGSAPSPTASAGRFVWSSTCDVRTTTSGATTSSTSSRRGPAAGALDRRSRPLGDVRLRTATGLVGGRDGARRPRRTPLRAELLQGRIAGGRLPRGACLTGIEPTVIPRMNETLDAETVEFFRDYNLYRVASRRDGRPDRPP